MSEPLVITISHKLGKEEALRRIKPGLSKASESFPVLKVEEEVWSGDRLDFRVRAIGQVAAGNVQVGDDTVRLEVTLPRDVAQVWTGGASHRRRSWPYPA